MSIRQYDITELIDSEIIPAPAEISNEMSKLPSKEVDDYGMEMQPGSADFPEGNIEEGVSVTRAMRNPRRAHNNMW